MGKAGWFTVRAAVAALLTAAIAACARPYGPAIESDAAALAPPPEGLGRIFFYRPANPLMAMVEPAVVVNGREVGALGPGEVFYRNARPGRYEVLIDTAPETPVAFRLEAGARRFIRVAPGWDLLGWRLDVSRVDRPEAEAEMRGLSVTRRPHAAPRNE